MSNFLKLAGYCWCNTE